MVRVTRSELNSERTLLYRIRAGNFIDCFTVAARMSPREAAGVITDFPRSARWLPLVRRLVIAPFGLSQDGPPAEDKIGPFPVARETARELVAGFDDCHLGFRVSVSVGHAR
ncbi:DUF2867 domain-containing protein [Ovoidimarina sediminis]|uniref:DUF2867 domain-containing protein n=1 Tax=Ovoidimarina sediminis TaxID=3079856 RepID=UPI002907A5B8|nr:DUF2867 domain-containing protein [Rhodophyticola sp. MJ-SS7]MDU8944747.1 DUF2867 domain-containing protein [Rhodophyticola sp. MJ-SS7]